MREGHEVVPVELEADLLERLAHRRPPRGVLGVDRAAEGVGVVDGATGEDPGARERSAVAGALGEEHLDAAFAVAEEDHGRGRPGNLVVGEGFKVAVHVPTLGRSERERTGVRRASWSLDPPRYTAEHAPATTARRRRRGGVATGDTRARTRTPAR